MTAQQWRLEVQKQGSTAVLRTFEGTAAKDGAHRPELGPDGLGGQDGRCRGLHAHAAVVERHHGRGAVRRQRRLVQRPERARATCRRHLPPRGPWLRPRSRDVAVRRRRGAARQGLTAAQILAFYYPGTTIATASPTTTMRVSLSAGVRTTTGGQDIRLRPATGLQVSEGSTDRDSSHRRSAGRPSRSGALLAHGGTLGLYGWTGSTYVALPGWTGRPGPFRFTTAPTASDHLTGHPRQRHGTRRRLPRRASRPGATAASGKPDRRVRGPRRRLREVGRVGRDARRLDRRRPTSRRLSRPAATASSSATPPGPRAASCDICDTTSCQVYNGYSGETSAEAKAATATAGQYLQYGGQPIFAEFGSASGGFTSDGGKPYLIAKADPYDGVVTGTANWGHAWTADVTATAVQSAYPSHRHRRADRGRRPCRPGRVGRSGRRPCVSRAPRPT